MVNTLTLRKSNPEFYVDGHGPLAFFVASDEDNAGSFTVKLQRYVGTTWSDIQTLGTIVKGGVAVYAVQNLVNAGKYRIYLVNSNTTDQVNLSIVATCNVKDLLHQDVQPS